MALRKLTQAAVLVGRKSFIARQVHATASLNFFNFKKPCPSSEGGLAVGFEKILMDAAKVGEDPLEDMNRDQKTPPTGGSGTKEDPYRMYSTAPSRYIEIEEPDSHGGPPVGFWCTLEEGGRCPLTGEYYVLDYDASDKWGIGKLDLFMH
ncbi:cytochrome c oxidase subunit 5B, mitochondrial [Ciona intestinalis]